MKPEFIMDPDAIAPALIPVQRLYTGALMPSIGLGTFGSDNYPNEKIAEAVRGALKVGYRFIDCAEVYSNEALIGEVFREALAEGLDRSELFVVSKVWNNHHDPEKVVEACKKSLLDLRLEYLDCYLVHWPFPNYHAPGCSVDSRNPDSRPYFHEEFMATWRAMESLVDSGLVRHIGVSNVTIPKLKMILRDARIKPAVNELELHPTFQQIELFDFTVQNGIAPIGYSPIGSPARPLRDRTPEDVSDLEHPIVAAIAQAHQIHPSAICLKWAAQRGQTPIPFTTTRSHYLANLEAIVTDPLSREEMAQLEQANCSNRLVKGQVFLWNGAAGWQDLWDVDGTIPGWSQQ